MKSPEGLDYDIQAADIPRSDVSAFIGVIVEIKNDDVVVDYEGIRVLVHRSDLQKTSTQ